MAKWHLMTPLATSERTCEAESEFWAKRKFAPIPKGWFVASDASYRVGWSKCSVPDACTKCFRNAPYGKSTYCEPCRQQKRREKHAAIERARRNAAKETRDARWRAKLSPEAKKAIAEREAKRKRDAYHANKKGPVRKYKARKYLTEHDRTVRWGEQMKVINIRAGIARRAEKRAQLTLSL